MKKFILPSLLLALTLSCSSDSGSDEMPNGDTLPVANFSADVTAIATGESVQFQSMSTNAESLLWTFTGGDPATSTEANPTVTYFNAGSFTVSLLASNSAGNHRSSETDYIMVTAPQEEFATYTVKFMGNWSAANHPTDFPASSDHFSSAVGMVHRAGARMFEEGELATEGIENMAELGANGALESEVDDIIQAGMARSYFSGGGLGSGTSEREFEIEVSSEFPLVSVVSMIAPSPDWFVAAQDVTLYDNGTGTFVDMLMVEALSYDSGTDSGPTFTSPNDDTNPAEMISRITGTPLGNGTTVDPPMAYFIFTKQ